MRKPTRGLLFVLMLVALLTIPSVAFAGNGNGNDTCTTIQDGTLLTSDGRVITPGYDPATIAVPVRAAEVAPGRPADLTMRLDKARRLLRTPLLPLGPGLRCARCRQSRDSARKDCGVSHESLVY